MPLTFSSYLQVPNQEREEEIAMCSGEKSDSFSQLHSSGEEPGL